jgi:hypothetical protein
MALCTQHHRYLDAMGIQVWLSNATHTLTLEGQPTAPTLFIAHAFTQPKSTTLYHAMLHAMGLDEGDHHLIMLNGHANEQKALQHHLTHHQPKILVALGDQAHRLLIAGVPHGTPTHKLCHPDELITTPANKAETFRRLLAITALQETLIAPTS